MKYVTKGFEELTVRELYEILRFRSEVFVVEQNCVYQDVDGVDIQSRHLFMVDDDGVICAYLRWFAGSEEGIAQIGRVLSRYRRRGIGSILLEHASDEIGEYGYHGIRVEAQTYAVPFYERAGFAVTSDEFDEDGIPHVEMRKSL
ncbi:MAG: GNAT family N-acetyltransferase [Solobacterium sp.]|nr:GNAT family N-acetyltransferase [Solobacterium sp.]